MQILSFLNKNSFFGMVSKMYTKTEETQDTNNQKSLKIAALKRIDSFEHRVQKTDNGTTYSPQDLMASDEMRASKIQSSDESRSTASYYNVVVNRAAEKAGVKVSASGSPIINSQYDYNSYQSALKSIQDTYWCQTGGWSNLKDKGKSECGRTALATMASINSGTVVTPNDTGEGMVPVTVNGKPYDREGYFAHNYDTATGAGSGYYAYGFSNTSDLIDAINTELS